MIFLAEEDGPLYKYFTNINTYLQNEYNPDYTKYLMVLTNNETNIKKNVCLTPVENTENFTLLLININENEDLLNGIINLELGSYDYIIYELYDNNPTILEENIVSTLSHGLLLYKDNSDINYITNEFVDYNDDDDFIVYDYTE